MDAVPVSASQQSLCARTAVVAGASSGIGLATARLFADHGAVVHALARRQDALIRGGGARVEARSFIPHAVDATSRSAVARCLADIQQSADIDVVVSTVGLNIPQRRIADLSFESWDAMICANLSSSFYLIKAALPSLRRTRGLVVLIGSASAVWPNMSGAAYQAAKSGLLGLARAASHEEHARGLRFSVILPGLADTPHLDRRATPPSAEVRARCLQPDDVAAACLYLATQPVRVHIPELVMLPTFLQAPGSTEVKEAPA